MLRNVHRCWRAVDAPFGGGARRWIMLSSARESPPISRLPKQPLPRCPWEGFVLDHLASAGTGGAGWTCLLLGRPEASIRCSSWGVRAPRRRERLGKSNGAQEVSADDSRNTPGGSNSEGNAARNYDMVRVAISPTGQTIHHSPLIAQRTADQRSHLAPDPSRHVMFEELDSVGAAHGVPTVEMTATKEQWRKTVWIRERPGRAISELPKRDTFTPSSYAPAP